MIAKRYDQLLLYRQTIIILFGMLLIVVSSGTITFIPFDIYQWAVVILWLVSTGLTFLPLYLEKAVLKRDWDWFSPLLFNIPFAYVSIFRPLFIAFGGWQTAWGHLLNASDIPLLLIKTMFFGIVGQVALLIGYYTPVGLHLSQGLSEISGRWSKAKLYVVAVIAIGAGLLSYFYLISNIGGITALLDQIGNRRTILSGTTYGQTIIGLIPLMGYLLWAHHLHTKEKVSFRWLFFFVCTMALFATLGGRGSIAYVGLIAVGIYHYLYRRIKLWQLLLIGLAAVQFFTIYAYVRQATWSRGFDLTSWQPYYSFVDDTLNGSEGVDRAMIVFAGVPDRIPFQFFMTYSRILMTIVPRQIWPDKPGLSEASVYAPLFGVNSQGKYGQYPAGSAGDFYLQLGLPGVMIGLFMGGVCRRLLYEYLLRFSSNPGVVVFYLLALSTGVFKLRNLSIVAFLLLAIPMLILILFVKKR